MDQLAALPPEIILRILDFACLDSLAKATRLNRWWHQFIDSIHPDAIYAAKLSNVTSLHDPGSYFSNLKSFAKYGDNVESWKDACRRQTLLARNWNAELPTTTESIIHFPSTNHFVWRFKPDFDRRLLISTSQAGGVYVVDLDTGVMLWSLQGDDVRGYAHLEYQDGTAVWDRFGDTLEVWKTDLPGLQRGHFRNVGLLPHHDAETRGFQLSYNTLCVASADGQGFVYDVPPGDTCPVLRNHLQIEHGAVGHLDQNEQAIMYSMGAEGYRFYDKSSGASIGHLRPHLVDPFKVYHINHPAAPQSDFDLIRREIMNLLPSANPVQPPFPPTNPIKDRLVPCRIASGPLRSGLLVPVALDTPVLSDDDWGAGMLDGKTMVGVSRGGRVIVCTDWQRALRSDNDFAAVTCIVECEPSHGSDFDLGGWLSIHEIAAGKRVIFEVKNRIYILPLSADGDLMIKSPVLVANTSSPPLGVPVSFMGVYDDCIMSTFTMVRPEMETPAGQVDNNEEAPAWRMAPTKVIRVMSFAPDEFSIE